MFFFSSEVAFHLESAVEEFTLLLQLCTRLQHFNLLPNFPSVLLHFQFLQLLYSTKYSKLLMISCLSVIFWFNINAKVLHNMVDWTVHVMCKIDLLSQIVLFVFFVHLFHHLCSFCYVVQNTVTLGGASGSRTSCENLLSCINILTIMTK